MSYRTRTISSGGRRACGFVDLERNTFRVATVVIFSMTTREYQHRDQSKCNHSNHIDDRKQHKPVFHEPAHNLVTQQVNQTVRNLLHPHAKVGFGQSIGLIGVSAMITAAGDCGGA